MEPDLTGTLMKKTRTLKHYKMNLRPGMFIYILHRVSGLFLLLFGILYLLSFSMILFGPEIFNDLMLLFDHPAFRIAGSLFVVALIFHVLSGIRILIIDLFNAVYIQRLLAVLVMILFVICTVLYYIFIISRWVAA
jgi:succinate dehydrogenase / fumarate reductase, cytochrome b subunit